MITHEVRADDLLVVRDLLEHDDIPAASELLRLYLDENPEDHNAIFLLGRVALKTGNPAVAILAYRRLIEINPDKPAAYVNLGRALFDVGQFEESLDCYTKAHALSETDHAICSGIASAHLNLGNLDEAERWAMTCFEFVPGDVQAWVNLAHVFLRRRDYARGWPAYALGIGEQTWRDRRQYNGEPDWKGERTSLCVYAEQGVGDQIAFLECFPDIAKMANVVVLNVAPKLRGLMARSFPDVPVHGDQHDDNPLWPERESIRASVAMSAMPQYVRKSADDYPKQPFLVADPERRIMWRALLEHVAQGRLKCGIAWTGGNRTQNRRGRSTNLFGLLPILSIPGTEWVSLEYKDRSEEIAAFTAQHGIVVHDWPHATRTSDLDDVAALIAELDVVVCVPTAAAHLCGGLGVEAHVIVHPRAHFHYGPAGDGMLYYGSVNLHRRTDDSPDEWRRNIAAVAEVISQKAKQATNAT